jgi:hypothetical protein
MQEETARRVQAASTKMALEIVYPENEKEKEARAHIVALCIRPATSWPRVRVYRGGGGGCDQPNQYKLWGPASRGRALGSPTLL